MTNDEQALEDLRAKLACLENDRNDALARRVIADEDYWYTKDKLQRALDRALSAHHACDKKEDTP